MTVRRITPGDIEDAVALQRACFPAPFPEELLWNRSHLECHLERFPEGQFVAESEGRIVGSASSCLISEENWNEHGSWTDTVGGPYIENHDPGGSTLYGLDVSVHPAYRGQGVGRALYAARLGLVRELGIRRYGTACRLPGFQDWSFSHAGAPVEGYVEEVVAGRVADRTLTPLLRYGLKFLGVIHDYMEDLESANAAVLLEWNP